MVKLHPLVSADVALFGAGEAGLQVLLLQRGLKPLAGQWALPGAVLNPDVDADLEATARRALLEKLGVTVPYLEQVRTFAGARRDSRGWSLSVLYCALLPLEQVHAAPVARVEKVRWVPADAPGRLAFDHADQLNVARSMLRERIRRHALPLHLMPEKFTLTQLQRVCESILRQAADDGTALDKSAFRRRLVGSADLVEVAGEFATGAQRPAQLYRMATGFRF